MERRTGRCVLKIPRCSFFSLPFCCKNMKDERAIMPSSKKSLLIHRASCRFSFSSLRGTSNLRSTEKQLMLIPNSACLWLLLLFNFFHCSLNRIAFAQLSILRLSSTPRSSPLGRFTFLFAKGAPEIYFIITFPLFFPSSCGGTRQ